MKKTGKKISVLHFTQNIQKPEENSLLHLNQTVQKTEKFF